MCSTNWVAVVYWVQGGESRHHRKTNRYPPSTNGWQLTARCELNSEGRSGGRKVDGAVEGEEPSVTVGSTRPINMLWTVLASGRRAQAPSETVLSDLSASTDQLRSNSPLRPHFGTCWRATTDRDAAHRNLAIDLLRLAGFSCIAAATRRLAALPWHALALLGCTRG